MIAIPRRRVAWWIAYIVCKPVLVAVRRRDWRDVDRIPSRGGAVLAVNHVSEIDPLLIAELVLARGEPLPSSPRPVSSVGAW